ncbi:thioredoxin-like domain-containing protein [Bacteroidota bacterium]
MKIRGFWILMILALVWSCEQEETGFIISGKLDDGGGQMIYLHEMTSRDLIPVDSVIIDTSGSFELRGISDETRFFAIHTLAGNYVYLLAQTGDRIILSGNAKDLPASYGIEGSDDSRLIRELTIEQNRTIERIHRLSKVFNDSLHSPYFQEIKVGLDSAYEGIINAQREFTLRFIEENLNSQASLMALYQQIGPRQYLLNPEEDYKYYIKVDSSLNILYPESDAVKDLHRQVEELKQRKQMESLTAARLGIGVEAPEIALPSPEGDTIVLSSLKGKIVLLDFWASWCAPCRHENPNLVKNYKKYKDKGFEIYQVSLDQTRAAWLKGIQDDELDWIHVSDLQYWNSIVVPVYNIQGIPMSYLLDREGKILAHSLRGEQLGSTLEEIFNP